MQSTNLAVKSTNLAVIHFSLTARFLSVYAKKTNPAVIHFSLIAKFVDNTLLDLQNSSYPTQLHSIIAKYQN